MKTEVRLCLAGIAFTAIIAFLLLKRDIFNQPSVRLTDGTIITLHHVTEGTRHPSSMVARILPAKWIPRKWQPNHYFQTTPAPVTLLWFQTVGMTGKSYRCSFTDTNGFGSANGIQERFRIGTLFTTLPMGNAPSNKFVAIDFYNKAETETLMVGFMGRLVVPNPVRKPLLPLRADSAPLTKSGPHGDLILETFEILPNGGEAAKKPFPVRAVFKHTVDGALGTNLFVKEVELSDCAGNVRVLSGPRYLDGNRFICYGAGVFHPEKGWRIKIKYFDRDFAQHEIMSFSDVPTPHHASKWWSLKTNHNRITVSLTSGRRNEPSRTPGLWFEASAIRPVRGKVIAVEADGEDVMNEREIFDRTANSMYSLFVPMPGQFRNRMPPKTMNLTVAFQAANEAEFVVIPRVVEEFPDPIANLPLR